MDVLSLLSAEDGDADVMGVLCAVSTPELIGATRLDVDDNSLLTVE